MIHQQRQRHSPNKSESAAANDGLERYIAKGRALRAEAVAALFAAGATRIARLLHSGLNASVKFGREAISWLAREHERRVSIRTLLTLDDHMLKDIGLSRSQIHAMVNGVFRSPEAGQSLHRATALMLAVNETAVNNDKVKRAA